MRAKHRSQLIILGIGLVASAGSVFAKPKDKAKAAPQVELSDEGKHLQNQYAEMQDRMKAEITSSLPTASAQKAAALEKARAAVEKASADLEVAKLGIADIAKGDALVKHAKDKWIGGAEKEVAAAKEARSKAKSAAERAAAEKAIAAAEANLEAGNQALKEREAFFDKAKSQESQLKKAFDTAQSAFGKAKAEETKASNAITSDLAAVLTGDKLEAKIVKGALLTHATPVGLAAFAQESTDKAALVSQLLSNDALMKEMLSAGGASFGEYGRAIEIYTAIQKASPKASSGNLQRLALATSLEHARPIPQSAPEAQTDGPANVDPVARYLHYEKAFLDGELDPAFKNFTTWEYRLVVNCDAPDAILAWGREMLRNYRPDHIYNPDYGWRYASTVKTEVPYGSQNVKYDLPTLHNYQNIIKNGGVCGRRAFFGRFILRSFGIPTWGVTQRAHAALSHWTPKGWVVNLGAGFSHSWWDKGEVSLSGDQFLLEAQARAHAKEYIQILRAEWISRILGEPAYNERKKIAGGFWSKMARDLSVQIAASEITLGPLGQELGEANISEDPQVSDSTKVAAGTQKIVELKDGSIVVPAVAFSTSSGKSSVMKSYLGGLQLHCLGGFTADYKIKAPKSGTYHLSPKLVTVQSGQKFKYSVGNGGTPIEVDVPYTTGAWQQAPPVELTLKSGSNTLNFELVAGSRGVTIKEFTLKLVK